MELQGANAMHAKKPSKLNTKNNGATPQTKQLIVKRSLNGNGIRNISRVLDVSINTVLTVFKKNTEIPNKHKPKIRKSHRITHNPS